MKQHNEFLVRRWLKTFIRLYFSVLEYIHTHTLHTHQTELNVPSQAESGPYWKDVNTLQPYVELHLQSSRLALTWEPGHENHHADFQQSLPSTRISSRNAGVSFTESSFRPSAQQKIYFKWAISCVPSSFSFPLVCPRPGVCHHTGTAETVERLEDSVPRLSPGRRGGWDSVPSWFSTIWFHCSFLHSGC